MLPRLACVICIREREREKDGYVAAYVFMEPGRRYRRAREIGALFEWGNVLSGV